MPSTDGKEKYGMQLIRQRTFYSVMEGWKEICIIGKPRAAHASSSAAVLLSVSASPILASKYNFLIFCTSHFVYVPLPN